MATVISPAGSFLSFQNIKFVHCVFGEVKRTLPAYADDDVAFQFVVRGTSAEADTLSTLGSEAVTVGLVGNSEELFFPTLIEFSDTPERFRISDTDVLYNWTAGFPGFKDVVNVGDCFRVSITVNLDDAEDVFISNDFERIGDDCFSSVLEYGNEDDAFGFNYCASSAVDPDGGGDGEEPPTGPPGICAPTRITFSNQATITIPYTASLLAAYGSLPTVQVWLYNEAGELVNAGVSVKFDASPPNTIFADFGGPASGILILK